MTQNFTHEQAEAIVNDIRSSVPLEVELNISDFRDVNTKEYQYSIIGFHIGDVCVATATDFKKLYALTAFIELMTGFAYPPRKMEVDPDGEDPNTQQQDLYEFAPSEEEETFII